MEQTAQPQDPVGSLSKQLLLVKTEHFVLVTIGEGGSTDSHGQATFVTIDDVQVVSAGGGGRAGGAGWSGVSGDVGGTNGQDGTGESLPRMCGDKVQLTPGAAGVNNGDGRGAGGVIVRGRKPTKRFPEDGEGFGAGGGEDNRPGHNGVVVLVLCD